jgi:CheY-like chemotaxis protein
VQTGHVELLICEVDLPPHDGFEFVASLRALPQGNDLPVLFLTRRADRGAVDRGFELGAVDYIIKPASPDVVVAKARNVLSRASEKRPTRGVSGSLGEMPLPDVLQILARTRKTGALRIVADNHKGEVQLAHGEVHQAHFRGLVGPEAVYALLALVEGEFVLDPTFTPNTRMIFDSTEQLLLEGMRRLDEAGPRFTRGTENHLASEPYYDPSSTHLDD